jgi:hypothetical protein
MSAASGSGEKAGFNSSSSQKLFGPNTMGSVGTTTCGFHCGVGQDVTVTLGLEEHGTSSCCISLETDDTVLRTWL